MESIGFELREEAMLENLTNDIIKTSSIEGEHLNTHEVRSSVARRMGMEVAWLVTPSRHVDGVVEMLLDATQNYLAPLD